MSQTSIEEVINQNNAATDYVINNQGPIDNNTAELLLRNTAVVADRLTPKQFSGLGAPAVDAMLDAAATAKEIAPLSEVDLKKLPTETRREHEYRTEIWAPLHRLQSVISLGEFDGSDPEMTSAVKRAVWLGSTSFEKVMQDPATSEYKGVQETVRYFGGNAQAAAGRAER